MSKFKGMPAQERVIRLLLERGFQVDSDGRVVSGKIDIPHTRLASEAGVERRVVDAATKTILSDPELKNIFQNIKSAPMLRDVAPLLGLGVIIITPINADDVGILGEVAGTVAKYGVSIRQAVTDDSYMSDDPKLTIVTDTPIHGELMEALNDLKSVKSITVY